MIFYGNISAAWIEEDTSNGDTVGKRLVRVEGALYGPPGREDVIRPGALAGTGELNATGPYDPALHALLEGRDPDADA